MDPDAQHTPQPLPRLEAVEALAVRLDDEPLALAALRARQNTELHRVLVSVPNELARMTTEHAGDAARLDAKGVSR